MSEGSLRSPDGVVRLFPLPNVVLFPHAMQPLHIFEPRYIRLTEDALADDGLITLVLLKPGWEADYWGRPPIYDVGCVGRIREHERLPNGRYNLVLQGLCRFRIESEIAATTPYRQAKGWAMPDPDIGVECLQPADHLSPQMLLKREILRELRLRLTQEHPLWEMLETLTELPVPLAVTCDMLAFVLPLATRVKQHLLETFDVEQRAQGLLRAVRQLKLLETLPMPREAPPFPPYFSPN
jgi:Lon protease-like protein